MKWYLGILFSLSLPLAAQDTIFVPGESPTIQGAIAQASNGDTILVSAGTYNEQIDFLGKAIELRSISGPSSTIIDSQAMTQWLNSPQGAVVRMINGEGPGSILEGFTVTGASNNSGGSFFVGLFCFDLSPTIRDCVFSGNNLGVYGDPIMDDSQVLNNIASPTSLGGGIYGSPTMNNCIVSGNRNFNDGGGIHVLNPCLIQNSLIENNFAGAGIDGYSGGGVYGPANLVSCTITGNTGYYYQSGGPVGSIGSAVDGANSIIGCTITGNIVGNTDFGQPGPGGAVIGLTTIRDSIIWGNEVSSFGAAFSIPAVTYSIIEGGAAGAGNLDLDPLFSDAANGNYYLQLGSPAIDAGDPAGALDPDGTRGDMGSEHFSQFVAALALRNGTGVNPVAYTSTSTPVIGTTWTAQVDTSLYGFPVAMTRIYAFAQPSAPVALSFGELLINTNSGFFGSSTAVPVGGIALHSIQVPTDYSLVGHSIATQAAVFGSAIRLTNALDLTAGL